MLKRTSRPSTTAIFIHAGAGYHSLANEKMHLEACSEAARVGMRFLKGGASATEAVEAALRCLEDKEITNAGFGSNLNMDGVVECDATIVDHLGRSGACGAVAGIKNPISLAKLILDTSTQPLSLRRVPPNILVGTGARLFAEEHHMLTVSNDQLVSRGANDRYKRWWADLKKAEGKSSAVSAPCKFSATVAPSELEYDEAATLSSQDHRRDHSNAILTGTWNEGQPDSPYGPGSPGLTAASPVVALTPTTASSQAASPGLTPPGNRPLERSPLSFFQARPSGSSPRPKMRRGQSDDVAHNNILRDSPLHDGSTSVDNVSLDATDDESRGRSLGSDNQTAYMVEFDHTPTTDEVGTAWTIEGTSAADDDMVNDTVGAIAIDVHGNIAGASSSGGIGMKHRGRIGPAALVGIGTAVIPEDSGDPDLVSVAAVTSGTGEHMATTMAAGRCAERLYLNTRRGPGGQNIEEWDETGVMESFITADFMGHPGVKNQCSAAAIGVMAVKKTRSGIYFYFAHNTDSFALASMSSKDSQPRCVMSRLGERGDISQGARKLAYD
ncbi:N-terminal nucleophile aminohydrolase [Thozetella sp. PMI_491]|nr:N-terminal nucleophile aminohydrolase [Thozetella sp. PMI_491]